MDLPSWTSLVETARWAPSPHNIQPWRPLEPATLAELERVAVEWGQTATFASDPELVRFVLELNRETLFYDLTDEGARGEVGSWLRFSARSAAETGDGFSPAALGFPG